jgi:hypothetical protein
VTGAEVFNRNCNNARLTYVFTSHVFISCFLPIVLLLSLADVHADVVSYIFCGMVDAPVYGRGTAVACAVNITGIPDSTRDEGLAAMTDGDEGWRLVRRSVKSGQIV